MKNRASAGRKHIWWAAGAAVMLTVFLLLGIRIWKDYRDTLMNNQIDQLKVTTQILSKNMEASIQSYVDDLDFFDDLSHSDNVKEIFQTYIRKNDMYIEDLFREAADGTWTESVAGNRYKDPVKISQMDPQRSLYQMSCEGKDATYLVVKKKRADGGYLCLAVNEEKYYNRIISDIKIGRNGYIVIKG